jgi:hypothetical protein
MGNINQCNQSDPPQNQGESLKKNALVSSLHPIAGIFFLSYGTRWIIVGIFL